MTDRITIATDMARERREAAGLGNGPLFSPVPRPNGTVDMLAVLVVSADDIDAQIRLERERGVERKPEDARPVREYRLTDGDIDGIAERGVGPFEDCLTGDEVTGMAREIRDSRAAIARVEALIERMRNIGPDRMVAASAIEIEAALRGERSGQ